ncbi:MAG TPA: hypothetical protein VHE30_10170 [Polyangiaceae bacterium]|nr:hypothetical protein [Polyangiaceae bacterium]
MKRRPFVAFFATGIVLSTAALAGVADDADRLSALLSRSGVVVRLAPRLALAREPVVPSVPVSALGGAPGCTTVVALGALSTVFSLRVPAFADGPPEFVNSAAGAAMVSRCDEARRELDGLTFESRSPRAVVEFLVATSATRPPAISALLSGRETGIVPPAERPGKVPHPGPLEDRLREFEEGLVRGGSVEVLRKVARADSDGAGKVLLDLSPGCHRIGVLAADDESETEVRDVDADLSWVSGELAASERTESPDATLFACTTDRDLAVLSFAGAAPKGAVVVSRGRAEIPAGIPRDWGRSAASAIARAVAERHAPPLVAAPVYSSLGVSGVTVLPVEVDPGRCYVAAVGLVEGAAKLVALAADAGPVSAASHGDDGASAVSVAFCAGTSRRATLTAEVHGTALVWALGLWATSSRRLGEGIE